MSKVSASKSALLLSPCLRWTGPEALEYDDKFTDTTKRDKGTDFHAGMDGYFKSKTYPGPAHWSAKFLEVTGWVSKAIEWSKQHLEPRCKEIHSEVYVAFNFDTGEVHTDPKVRDRKYPAKPGYVPGTGDLAGVLTDESLLVADWKTGGGTGADKQLLTLALGLREVFRLPSGLHRKVRLALLYAGPDGVHPVEWEASESDLLSHQHAMAFQLADVGKRNDPVPGIHCSQLYCPHLAHCPGVTGLVETSAEAPQGLLPIERILRTYRMEDRISSDHHAGYVMERVTAAKRQLAYYESCVKQWADGGGKVLAGDFEYSKGNNCFRWRESKGR